MQRVTTRERSEMGRKRETFGADLGFLLFRLLVKEDHLMTNERALEIWKRWYTFLGGKLALHNGSAPLFRSMPFVDDSKDHRLDRPFGTRVLIALSAIGVSFLLLRTLLRMRERPVEKQF